MDPQQKDEILEYRERFKNCTPEQIMEILEEMWQAFWGRMSPQQFAEFERLRAYMSEPAPRESSNST